MFNKLWKTLEDMHNDFKVTKNQLYESTDWADAEFDRLAAYNAEQRKNAIEYLGDKWLLKSGAYSPKTVVLHK